jgi:hypothetical protein
LDRGDARFLADVLTARLDGDAKTLGGLLSFEGARDRLRELAEDLKDASGGEWMPAIAGVIELVGLADDGVAVLEEVAPDASLRILVESLEKLAGEPPAPARNRHDRRKSAKLHLPRRSRLVGSIH